MREQSLNLQREGRSLTDEGNSYEAKTARQRSRSIQPAQMRVSLAPPENGANPGSNGFLASRRKEQRDRMTPFKRSAEQSRLAALPSELHQDHACFSGPRTSLPVDSYKYELNDSPSSPLDGLPPSPATSRRSQLQRQSSRSGRQRFEAFRRVKLTALLEGCAALDVDSQSPGLDQLADFMRIAISAAKGELPDFAEEASSCQDSSIFAQAMHSYHKATYVRIANRISAPLIMGIWALHQSHIYLKLLHSELCCTAEVTAL